MLQQSDALLEKPFFFFLITQYVSELEAKTLGIKTRVNYKVHKEKIWHTNGVKHDKKIQLPPTQRRNNNLHQNLVS